ncbi:MAG TPA: hypothetical protein VLW85_07425 [Myxococcales bacterium]|nr:hypothetical protein [Myxococcales bacterium]
MLMLLAALACTGPDYHRLDFWLGEWDVASPAGQREGHNLITAEQDGCVIRERWTDKDGGTGESIFWFDQEAKRWKQVWVTSGGTWKEKLEQPSTEGVVFRGARDHTTLSKLPDGRVRQLIEANEGPARWEGLYTRRAPACKNREFDFWLGDWDVAIHARPKPDAPYAEARGQNHVTLTHAGCVIEEHFSAGGPGSPWAGHSVSAAVGDGWRQTWVDDSGGFLAFKGGMRDGRMVLVGEPQPDKLMRMVYQDIARDSLKWTWERSEDQGKTWTPMMIIDYRRRR